MFWKGCEPIYEPEITPVSLSESTEIKTKTISCSVFSSQILQNAEMNVVCLRNFEENMKMFRIFLAAQLKFEDVETAIYLNRTSKKLWPHYVILRTFSLTFCLISGDINSFRISFCKSARIKRIRTFCFDIGNRNQGPISVSVSEPNFFFPELKLIFSCFFAS